MYLKDYNKVPVLDHEDILKIKDSYRKVSFFWKTKKKVGEERNGNFGFQRLQKKKNSRPPSSSGEVQYQDPILISMIRNLPPT